MMNKDLSPILDQPTISPTLLGEVAGLIMLEEKGLHIDSNAALALAKERILEFMRHMTEAGDRAQARRERTSK